MIFVAQLQKGCSAGSRSLRSWEPGSCDRRDQLMQFSSVVIAWRTCLSGVCVIVHNNVVIGSGRASVQLRVEGELCQGGAAGTGQPLQMAIASCRASPWKQALRLGCLSGQTGCGVPLDSKNLRWSPFLCRSPEWFLTALDSCTDTFKRWGCMVRLWRRLTVKSMRCQERTVWTLLPLKNGVCMNKVTICYRK